MDPGLSIMSMFAGRPMSRLYRSIHRMAKGEWR